MKMAASKKADLCRLVVGGRRASNKVVHVELLNRSYHRLREVLWVGRNIPLSH